MSNVDIMYGIACEENDRLLAELARHRALVADLREWDLQIADDLIAAHGFADGA